ncbi:MAG: hypothetical protein H7123_06635 [Thermoleophilia bacterium]|nr:hypothetical protein [Thermoleophilia bacterium]
MNANARPIKLTSIVADMLYTIIAWAPILIVLFVVSVVAYGSLGQLGARTNGTEYVVPNSTSMGHPLHPVDVNNLR